MCYRCQICDRVVPAGVARRTHVIYRDKDYARANVIPSRPSPFFKLSVPNVGREIDREMAVCHDCFGELEAGLDLAVLQRSVQPTRRHDLRVASAPARVPTPPPTPPPPVLPKLNIPSQVPAPPPRRGLDARIRPRSDSK